MGKEKWELIAKKVYLSPSCAVLADIVLVRGGSNHTPTSTKIRPYEHSSTDRWMVKIRRNA